MNMNVKFTEIDLQTFVTDLGIGDEITLDVLSTDEIQRLEDFLNWKLNDIDYWQNSPMKPNSKIKISELISDRDIQLFSHIADGNTYYEMWTSSDRCVFEATILMNDSVTEFEFVQESW